MADHAEAGKEHATLSYPGGELELDIVKATEGADGIALGSLLAKTGYTTFDGGFYDRGATIATVLLLGVALVVGPYVWYSLRTEKR